MAVPHRTQQPHKHWPVRKTCYMFTMFTSIARPDGLSISILDNWDLTLARERLSISFVQERDPVPWSSGWTRNVGRSIA